MSDIEFALNVLREGPNGNLVDDIEAELERLRDEWLSPADQAEWAAENASLKAEVERLHRIEEAAREANEIQPKVLAYIQANGFKWEGMESLGAEPGNWQHLAFSIYSDLCNMDAALRAALGEE